MRDGFPTEYLWIHWKILMGWGNLFYKHNPFQIFYGNKTYTLRLVSLLMLFSETWTYLSKRNRKSLCRLALISNKRSSLKMIWFMLLRLVDNSCHLGHYSDSFVPPSGHFLLSPTLFSFGSTSIIWLCAKWKLFNN